MKKLIITLIIFLVFLEFFSSYAQTWVRKNEGYGFWSIQKDFAGNIYAGTTGTARGIFKSTDGGETWTNVYSTGSSNYLDIAFDQLNNVYVANSSNGLLISTDGGNTFTTVSSGTFGGSAVNTVACGQNGLVLVGVTSGGVYRSTDYGSTFTQTLAGYSIVSLDFDKFTPNRVYAGSSSTSLNGFFISTDGGLTFTGPTSNVNVWEILQKNDGTLFTLSTSSGYPVNKSTDFGLNWTTVGNTPAAIRGACLDLSENIYAAGNGGVYKSTDGGATFQNFNFTYSSNKIISFQNRILNAVSGTTNGGIYIYTDESIPVELTAFSATENDRNVVLHWTTSTETNNLGFEVQRSVIIGNELLPWQNIGFVDGNGTTTEMKNYSFIDENLNSGIYRYRLKQIDYNGTFTYSEEIQVNKRSLPTEFYLHQNYPNPFNPTTTIQFALPERSSVVLKIYDLLGNEVETLLNDVLNAGLHSVIFDGAKLSSGVYLYKLMTEKNSELKKMILVK